METGTKQDGYVRGLQTYFYGGGASEKLGEIWIRGRYDHGGPSQWSEWEKLLTEQKADKRYASISRINELEQQLAQLTLKYERLAMTLGLEDDTEEEIPMGQTLEEQDHQDYGDYIDAYIPDNTLDTLKGKYGVDK